MRGKGKLKSDKIKTGYEQRLKKKGEKNHSRSSRRPF